MYKLKNLAKGTLNAQLLSGGTSLTLESGEGAKFPDTGSDNVFVGVLWGSDFVSPEADSNAEFVTAYRTSGDTFTLVRAQEGTSASQWEIGDLFSLVASSAVLNRLIPWADSQTVKTSNYTFTGAEEMNSCWNGSTSGGSLTFSVNPNLFSTGFELHFSKGTADANTLTLDAGSGNNINGSQTFVISRQYAVITLIKDGANTWRVKSSYPSVTYPSGAIVGTSDSQTLTNKTIDADDNTISNLETDNFKSGVIDTDETLSSDSDTKIPTQKAVKGYVDSQSGGGEAFAVGGVYMNITGTNPNTELGYGTWSRIAEGQMLVGQKSSDSDFDTAEETGGEKTHTLTISEMPAHDHGGSTGSSSVPGVIGSNQCDRGDDREEVNPGGHSHSIPSQGGGVAHNNMPPYFVVYMWKRTA